MHTDTYISSRMNKFIYWSFVFLFLGLITSPTVVSAYHIFAVIPAILIFKKTPKFKLPKSSLFLLALGSWGLISNFVNIGELQVINKSFQELKYYFFAVLFIPLVKTFSESLPDSKKKILLNILFITIIVAFFVGISKAWFGFDPVKFRTGSFHIRSGGFSNYMRYGYSSAFLFLIFISMFLNREKLKPILKGKLFIAALIFSFLAICTSQTRGALLGLIVSLPFLFLRYKPKLAKILIGLGVVFFLIVGSITIFSKSTNRYLDINDSSNNTRLSQFYTAIKVIQDNPIFGLGADQFSYNVKKYKEKYNIWARTYSGHSHNILLEHGANYGIVGLVLFLGFLVFWFIEMFQLKTAMGWAMCSYLIAFFTAGQVELLFDVVNSHIIFFLYSFSQSQSLNISALKVRQ